MRTKILLDYNDLLNPEVVEFVRVWNEGVEVELQRRGSMDFGVDHKGRVYTFKPKQPDQDILMEVELLRG